MTADRPVLQWLVVLRHPSLERPEAGDTVLREPQKFLLAPGGRDFVGQNSYDAG